MIRDPIVEEVRRTRYQISSKYRTHEEYCRHLRSIQKKYAGRLVRRRPRPALRRKAD
jgi:hypothetical protein